MRALVLAAAVALAGCAPTLAGQPGPVDERCEWSGRYRGAWVFQEQESIVAYFEATRLDEYRRVLPAVFAMPERPLVRVSVIDFYEMVNGAAYLESVIALAAVHEGRSGWFVVTMPVTNGDSCYGGRSAWGYPKVVRRITLEKGLDRYVGVSYAPGGRVPEFRLTLDAAAGAPGDEAHEVLRHVAPMVGSFTLKDGRVLRFGAGGRPAYDLERAAPSVWKVWLGRPTLEFPREPDNLLQRLGTGRALAGYWVRQRARYSIAPS